MNQTDYSKTDFLKPRQQVPYFQLPAVNHDEEIGPGNYRQRTNLLLVFLHDLQCPPCAHLLQNLAENYREYQRQNTEVLAIVPHKLEQLRPFVVKHELPFPVLADSEARVSRKYFGQAEETAPPQAAGGVGLFITDRWGALYLQSLAAEATDLPRHDEIRDWLEFVELQCGECFPPEWPA